MTTEIAVVGDLFMRSALFEEALKRSCRETVTIRSIEMPVASVPAIIPGPDSELAGLNEFYGDPEEIVNHVGIANVFVTNVAPLSKSMLARMPNLEFVAVARGGPVNVDVAALRKRGIRIVNSPGRNATAVAEFTVAVILSQTRNITLGHDALRNGVYRQDLYDFDLVGPELSEATVGIIGYGHLGRLVVKLLSGFGCKVLITDPFASLTAEDAAAGVEQVSLDHLLGASDIVSLHQRVTDDTVGMINETSLSQMKPGSYLVNTARGPLVDYDALHEKLKSGHIRGAALETFPVEPVPRDWPLLKCPNVTLTPHIAGASKTTATRAAKTVADDIGRWLRGENLVNEIGI